MISIQKQFLFIHVPKTGGNSIQNILRNYSEDEIVVLAKHQDGVERFGVRNKKYNFTKHSTLSHYKSVLDTKIYSSLFKFATIRNPWDRMISFYFSPHRGITIWDRNNFIALVHTIPPFRHYVCEKSSTGRIDSNLDYLIRFEQIDHDFNSVCNRLDIPISPLPKRNVSPRRHYSEYYDDELREIVGKKFKEEIEFGDYIFENGS